MRITEKRVANFLGNAKFQETQFTQKYKPGLCYGLAWTEMGGMLLPVEVALLKGDGKLILTGSLGDVMKESAQTALSFLRSQEKIFSMPSAVFEKKDIHIHVPEGAIPKDGPSAGITITAALLSAATGITVKKGYAMTGEITLTDRLLPIGGVKQKILAAHRHKMTNVLLPLQNKKDTKDLPREVIDALEFIYADSIIQALGKIFPPEIYKHNNKTRT
jgi:ATP-dependent Lon protease